MPYPKRRKFDQDVTEGLQEGWCGESERVIAAIGRELAVHAATLWGTGRTRLGRCSVIRARSGGANVRAEPIPGREGRATDAASCSQTLPRRLGRTKRPTQTRVADVEPDRTDHQMPAGVSLRSVVGSASRCSKHRDRPATSMFAATRTWPVRPMRTWCPGARPSQFLSRRRVACRTAATADGPFGGRSTEFATGFTHPGTRSEA